jgi:hypothetical protein
MKIHATSVKVFSLSLLVLICSIPSEGYVSQVAYFPGFGLNEALPFIQHAVKATPLHKTEIFKEAVFPKETSFKHTESKYNEYVTLYMVDEVIVSSDLTQGNIIRVWKEPAYGIELAKIYHETGLVESPAILRYTPLHTVKENGQVILLLGETYSENSTAYNLRGTEAATSEDDVRQALAERKVMWSYKEQAMIPLPQ